MSNTIIEKSIRWGDANVSLETGRIARHASCSVVVKYNNTVVLVTVTSENSSDEEKRSGVSLMVNFVYKSYARCKIPAGFIKREGKATEREILASRIIDRSLRPLIPQDFTDDLHLVCTLLSHDDSVIPEIPSLIGASAALNISHIPFLKPVVAAHICCDASGHNTLNVVDKGSKLDLIVAATSDSILMVESEAKELSEEEILKAIMYGHKNIQPVIAFIEDFSNHSDKSEKIFATKGSNLELQESISRDYQDELIKVYEIVSKKERVKYLSKIKDKFFSLQKGEDLAEATIAFQELQKKIVRGNITKLGKRSDGRKHDEIRELNIIIDILPNAHGSALFTRGNTQALVVVTLGDYSDEQIIDGVDGNSREHFMLHYNFPPYAVGEASSLRAPGRREIGHGRLAWHALQSVLTNKENFPYTVRVVSEITESDGSSSMATVCASSLALMAAGVPIKSHVAGIAMGLIKHSDGFVVLSDISGEEDHFGDMDFKVAGTKDGITALQMDIKISGITEDVMRNALAQAKSGRMHILDKMMLSIPESRKELKENAPNIASININQEDITKVIGSGGKVIKNICEVCSSKIDIDSTGKVLISSDSSESLKKAMGMLNSIIEIPKTGIVYDGEVVGVAEFGAFVKISDTYEGLVHISEIQDGHVHSIDDVIKVGERVRVAILSIDKDKRIRLSMKYVDQESGKLFSGDYNRAVALQATLNHKKRRNMRGVSNGRDDNNKKSDYQKRRPKFF